MLVLTRKTNEAIRIGQDVSIRVVSLKGNRVTLAIEAPNEVRIMREELIERPLLKETA